MSVRLVGSRAEGRASPHSDYDFVVEVTNFPSVAGALPDVLAVLRPLAQQWDRLGDEMCWMIMLDGPVKVDLIFPGHEHEHESPWSPSRENLEGIDAHFWDWVLWLRSKEEKGDFGRVASELRRLHEHLLSPLGEREPPSSIADAVDSYRTHRDDAERRSGRTVPRKLEDAVLPALR